MYLFSKGRQNWKWNWRVFVIHDISWHLCQENFLFLFKLMEKYIVRDMGFKFE